MGSSTAGALVGLTTLAVFALLIYGVVVVIRSIARSAAQQRRMSSLPPPSPEIGAPAGGSPGWYVDPGNAQILRYYDGRHWTSATRPQA